MVEWHTRFGVAIPAANPVVEYEFPRQLPAGVSFHVARTWSKFDSGDRKMDAYRDHLQHCGRLLAQIDPAVIAFCATKASLWGGAGYDSRIEAELSDAAGGIPAVAASASVVRALESVGLESVAVFTPYDEQANERIAEFFAESGFAVERVTRIETAGTKPGGPITEESYRDLAGMDRNGADCTFISSTLCETFDVIEPLERRTGKPVITSNQATLWDACRVAGIDTSGITLGRLFDE